MRKICIAAFAVISISTVCVAQSDSAKLVDVETGEISTSTVLTNGACFKMGETTYRLEIDQSADAKYIEELSTTGVPVRMQDLSAKDAFTMLTHLSGTTIVCARDVDKDLKVSINTQDDSVMDIIEQICFQIDAEPSYRKQTVWIKAKKAE
ncbi:hypothetical protein [Pontiella sp.]|uniref:hypothetical protein n=1 Tax=Pontiella sp. TaxID=2837462 RepID=UPI0035658223